MVASAGLATAKPQAKAGGLTQNDVRMCMGIDGATPADQISACTKVIKSGKVKPQHLGDYYATRGAAYLSKKDLKNALADFDKALSLRKAPEFYFQRSLVRISQRDYAAAKTDLQEVAKLKPDFPPTYLMGGIIAFSEGAYPEAVAFFDKAIDLNPNYYQALYARGVAKKKSGENGDKDIAAAKAMSPRVEKDMQPLGIAP